MEDSENHPVQTYSIHCSDDTINSDNYCDANLIDINDQSTKTEKQQEEDTGKLEVANNNDNPMTAFEPQTLEINIPVDHALQVVHDSVPGDTLNSSRIFCIQHSVYRSACLQSGLLQFWSQEFLHQTGAFATS